MKNNSLLVGISVTGLVIAVVVLAFFVINQGSSTTTDDETISVTGIHTLSVIPDEVEIHLSVETLADSAKESEQDNRRIMEQVMRELKLLGVDDDQIETTGFNVYQEYDYSREGRTPIGFKTINSFVITLEEFTKVGDIVDTAVNAGVNMVQNIQFTLSKEKEAEVKKEALAEASKDAREKAEAIADGLGVRIGKIRSVSSQDYFYQPRFFYEGGTAFAESAVAEIKSTPINPRELETTGSVSVTFEIR